MINLHKKQQRGFTLIELLVVIAIIGILAGIVLVSLGGARKSARDAKRQSDISNVGTAMELYYNDNAVYLVGATATTPPTVIGTYMVSVPKDPGSGNPVYGWVDNGGNLQDYCVFATLEKSSAIPGNKLYFAAGPGGSAQKDVLSTFTPTLTACE